jgi:hypothetical protein
VGTILYVQSGTTVTGQDWLNGIGWAPQLNMSPNFGDTEAQNRFTVPVDGVFSRMNIRFAIQNPSSNVVYRSRINGVNGNQTITKLTTANGGVAHTWTEDTTNSDAVVAGDTFNWQVTTAALTTDHAGGVCVFVPTAVHCATHGGKRTSIASALTAGNRGFAVGGQVTTPLDDPQVVGVAGTARYVEAVMITNTHNGSIVASVQVNGGGVSGAAVTVGAGVTGSVRDTSGTVAIAVGDLIDLRITESSASGAATARIWFSTIPSTGTATDHFACGAGGNRLANAAVHYWGMTGIPAANNATESLVNFPTPMDITISRMRLRFTTNTYTGSANLRQRINGADGNGLIVLGAGVTGWVTDSSNTDNALAGDMLNYSIDGGTSGSANCGSRAFTYDFSPPAPGGVPLHRFFSFFD